MADKSERSVGDSNEAIFDVSKTRKKSTDDAKSDSKQQQTTNNCDQNSEPKTKMGTAVIPEKNPPAVNMCENLDANVASALQLETSEVKKTNSSLFGSLFKSVISGLKSSVSASFDTYKMVFVVNKSLEMGVGKIATQVAHSAIGIHSLMLQDKTRFGDALTRWYVFGQTKIVLRGNTTQHLVELEKKAIDIGLATYLVHDAGKTQIPSGSKTVLSIFGKVDLVDSVTGSLRLL